MTTAQTHLNWPILSGVRMINWRFRLMRAWETSRSTDICLASMSCPSEWVPRQHKKKTFTMQTQTSHTRLHTHTHKYKRTHTQTQTRTRTNAQTHTRTMKTSNSSKHLNGHSITSHSAMRNESVEYDFSPPVAFATTRNACLGVEVEAANGEGGNKQTKRSFNISEPLVPLETVCIRT